MKLDGGEANAAAPFLSFADASSREPAALAATWQHVIDGLTEQIALLDENWTILIVNRSWANVAKLYGHRLFVPGADYLACCREMSAQGLEVARDVAEGIEQIIAGKRSSFQLVYRAREPELGRDHQLCVNEFEVAGRRYASVTRYDVTRLIELRRLRMDFSHSVMVGQAEERRRIGREIHDSTAQLIACMGMKIGELKRSCTITSGTEVIEEMEQLLAETQREIRSIAYLAHPPALGEMALLPALRTMVEGFGLRVGLEVELRTVGTPQLGPRAAEDATYRIVQEALSNVHRHAAAKRATVTLRDGKRMTHIVIGDDGIGMPAEVRVGVGLAGMRSRLSELGGRLRITAGYPGTVVIASFPKPRR